MKPALAKPKRRQSDIHEDALYGAHGSPATARRAVADFARSSGRAVRGATVLVQTPVDDLVSEVAAAGVRVHGAGVNNGDDVWVLDLSRRWGRTSVRYERGRALLVRSEADDAVFHVYTGQPAGFWSGVVGFMLRKCYPDLWQASLTTAELEEMLRDLVARANLDAEDLRITDLTYRSRLEDPRSRKDQESDRKWTDLGLPSAFEQLRELDASLERVSFECGDVRASLGRRGEFIVAGGFSAFHAAVAKQCAQIAAARMRCLEERERREETQFEARPFFIQYDSDLLSSDSARRRLVSALTGMSRAAVTVVHENPYVYACVLDYLDDASCDVFVMSTRRITVVPQTRSSAASLQRLYAHICAEFGEGRIEDFSQVYGP